MEIEKILKNKLTYITLGLSLTLIGLNVYLSVHSYNEEINLTGRLYSEYSQLLKLVVPSNYWIGNNNSLFSGFYYLIFPLLVAIPIVGSIYDEKYAGYQNFVLIRMNRSKYYIKKYLITFIIAFLLFIIPIFIGNAVINLITNHWDYSDYSHAYSQLINNNLEMPDSIFDSYKKDLFSGLMEISPYMYYGVYYLIGGIYAGLYASIGLSISLLIKNRYLVIFSPIMVYLGMWILFTVFSLQKWDPFNFLVPYQGIADMTYSPFIMNAIFLFILSLIIYIVGVNKNEDII